MQRRILSIVTVCMFVGLASIPAWGDSPHYLKANTSFSSQTACYSVAIKEAGLGNSGLSSLTYTLTCRNGQTTGTISLCPASFTLPDPGCTGSQKLVITAAAYSNCSVDDSLGTASPSLDNLGGSNLSVPVP